MPNAFTVDGRRVALDDILRRPGVEPEAAARVRAMRPGDAFSLLLPADEPQPLATVALYGPGRAVFVVRCEAVDA